MTDDHAPTDDELVSAYLDGEATPEERARVENDPALQARLAEFRSVSGAVGTPSFFDSPDRDTLIAQAIRAGNRPTDADNVVSLDGRRSLPRSARFLPAIAAAAAVALLAVGAITGIGSGDGQDDMATSADSAEVEELTPAEELSADSATEPDRAGGTEGFDAADDSADDSEEAALDADGPLPAEGEMDGSEFTHLSEDLGEFPSDEEADAAIERAIDPFLDEPESVGVDPNVPPATTTGDLVADCVDPLLAVDPELGALVWSAELTIMGVPHAVLLFEVPVDGTYRLHVIADGDCDAPLRVETLPSG